MDTILNTYDGAKKPTKTMKAQIALDFIYSQDSKEVDAGIRETLKGMKVSIMAMGIALYRVDVGGLFIDLGFKKFGEYIDHLAEDTGMNRSTFYNWEYMGEAYLKYRSDLDKIGFTEDDGPTKLPYLPRALENYTKREVFKNLMGMSKREFEEWSKGEPVRPKYKNVTVKGNSVFVGKTPLASFAEGISPQDRRYYESLLMEGALAIKQNQYAGIYLFYDSEEKKRFDKVYQRELKFLRAKR